MSGVIVANDRYTVDPLYQWDVDQFLEIRGLSLSTIPEIHFTNDSMGRCIVRQSTKDEAGIIAVKIPNSLLQKPYTIKAHICIYEGDTFKTVYTISIPVKPRKMPVDYTLENDEEIYSFKALENSIKNALVVFDKANAKYEDASKKYSEAVVMVTEATDQATQAKRYFDSFIEAYNNASESIDDFTENYNDILNVVQNKANKSNVIEATLSASGWSGNTYSLESDYPVTTYDIEIALNSTATEVQVEAFNSAQIVGSATSNIVTAFGNVPAVDIPIIIKVVTK